MTKMVRPDYYGQDVHDPYEAIQVIEAWDLNFSLGSAMKYICRAGRKGQRKGSAMEQILDLEKAATYLHFEIARRRKMMAENEQLIHEHARMVQSGEEL